MLNFNTTFSNLAKNSSGKFFITPLVFALVVSSLPLKAHAQVAGQPAFEKMRELIFQYAGLIGAFLIVPIGVLSLVVSVVRLIWSLMTGETHGIGGKLGWILFTILLTAFGVWLAANAQGIFA
jgi:hypothetical protein